MDKLDNKIKKMISISAEVIGNTVAEGVLGYLTSGTPGAIVGAYKGATKSSIKRVTQEVVSDVANRVLSTNEELRVGMATIYTINKIQEYVDANREPREDIFEKTSINRNSAEEIFEGVLLKSKTAYEEKKIKYISNIFANYAYDESISQIEANFRLSISEQMTYNQFCILALLGKKENTQTITLKNSDYIKGEKSYELRIILNEIYKLYNDGMIQWYSNKDNRAYALSGILSIIPNEMRLTINGKRQYDLMGLQEMNDYEVKNIIDVLS